MARRKKVLVWTAERYEQIGEYSKAEVSVRLHQIGLDNMYDYVAMFRISARDGESFNKDCGGYFDISSYDLDVAAEQISALREFLGGGKLNADTVRKAMANSPQGFYDSRGMGWQTVDKQQKKVYEPALNGWNDELDLSGLEHLFKIYAASEEDAKEIVAKSLVSADRLDILLDWSTRGMNMYEITSYHDDFVPANLAELFAPAPHNVKPEPEEPEEEVADETVEEPATELDEEVIEEVAA